MQSVSGRVNIHLVEKVHKITPCYTETRFNIILSFFPVSPKRFPDQYSARIYLSMRATCTTTHLIQRHLSILTITSEEALSSTCLFLNPNVFIYSSFPDIPLRVTEQVSHLYKTTFVYFNL
jgi:hypothetical protein